MTEKRIEIFDSTLRDGAQAQNISFTLQDKLSIAAELDELGVTFIEGGNPSSNPKDLELFERTPNYKNAKSVMFGSTRRHGVSAEEDKNLGVLARCPTDAVCIVGKASAMQVRDVLKTTLDENIAMIADTVSFLKTKKSMVMFDAEHFFDGFKEDRDYAVKCLSAAQEYGADRIILCDTNGGCFPDEIFNIITEVKAAIPSAKLGIHCHNDNGCAVANSIMAVKAGAIQVQGTYLGFGERCGNANLSAIIPSLQLKLGYYCIPEENMVRLSKSARFIAETANFVLDSQLPYVGKSAFAHKAGMHVDGVNKNPSTFEHIKPESVGNKRNIILSEMAGRAAMLTILQSIDPTVDKESAEAAELTDYLKELEASGYIFETAQASLKLRLLRRLNKFSPYFKLIKFKVMGENASQSSAMTKIEVNGQSEITAAEGDGPVHALDLALKKAVERFYPEIARVRLIDYKVRVMEPSAATAALVRVLISSTDGEDVWTTVGVSRDIIEASLFALIDSAEYMLLKNKNRQDEEK